MLAVYVPCAVTGDLRVLHLDEDDGSLTAAQAVAVGGDNTAMPLAVSPDRRFLYAALRTAPFAAFTFAIDPADGRLTEIGRAPLSHAMAFIATDRSGRWLLAASYVGHHISVSPIGADGCVQAPGQVLATGPHPHAIRADAANRFVLAPILGEGRVSQWRFDAATGRLTPNDPFGMAPHAGASPRHLLFSADERFVYVVNELDGAVDVLAFDASRGTLAPLQTVSALPDGFMGEAWSAELRLTPDGRFLYATDRRASTLATFAVDAATGLLTRLGTQPTETQCRGFAISGDGRFLVIAGQLSNRVASYRRDAASGALTRCGECAVGGDPNWVEVLGLPVRAAV